VTCLDPLTRHSHAPLVGAPLDFTALCSEAGGAGELCAAVIDEANRSDASLICRNGDRTDLPTGVTRSFGVRRGQH
jgi:hypothetical protein